MKYVEQIKTIALFLLVFLSLALTFTVWTLTPSYDTLESTPAPDELLGDTKKIEQVVQPLKVLYHYEDFVTGTNEKERMDMLLNSMKQWQISELALESEEASPEELTALMSEPGRTVVYYPTTVPYPVFDTIMDIADTTVSESTFDRVVIEWGSFENGQVAAHFVNTSSGRVYGGNIQAAEFETFRENVVEPAEQFPAYIAGDNIGELPVYVPEDPIEDSSYTFIFEEIAIERFAAGLFEGNSIDIAGNLLNGEYIDENGARLGGDESTKKVTYLQPQAQTSDPAIPSELVFNTFAFVNEHGGWTNDYQYFGINPVNQQVNYQLFMNNMPVFSSDLITDMTVTWGIADEREQVYSYIRPFYMLEPTERTTTDEQASGKAVLKALNRLSEGEKSKITEIIPSYELVRSTADPDRLLSIEPTWHFEIDGRWVQLTNGVLGGDKFGLE